MTNEADKVKIGGSFVTDSSVNHSGKLTAGTMEISGDFTQNSSKSSYNFAASGSHKVTFTSDKKHVVSVSSQNASYFNKLDITGAEIELKYDTYLKNELIGEDGVITGKTIVICNNAKVPDVINGNVEIYGNYTLAKNVQIKGSLYLYDSQLDLSGYTLTVEGDTSVDSATVNMNNGIYNSNGNFSIGYYSRLNIVNSEETLNVQGNFSFLNPYNYNSQITSGKINIKGNCVIDSGYFRPSGENEIIFSGEKKQCPCNLVRRVPVAN